MSDILCVTNRKLCKEDFLCRIESIAKAGPKGIILREKDLSENEYKKLAVAVAAICKKHGVSCILHSFTEVARILDADAIHLPLPILRSMSMETKRGFSVIGASCHSVEEAKEAQQLGCTYITAGHIFATDCKKGLPGRGVAFLENVCENVSVPVYGIGGIGTENIADVCNTGARGVCIMSELMRCVDVKGYMEELRNEI